MASRLGFSMIGVTFSERSKGGDIAKARELCAGFGIDMVSRIDITVGTRERLLRALGRMRRLYEIVAVVCTNDVVSHVGARDRRVDILDFPGNRSLSAGVIKLALSGETAFEVNANEIIDLQGPPRIRLISKLRREVGLAERYGIPIVVSSGATGKLMLRAPRELAFFAASLLDMGKQNALKTVSENPTKIVLRNREKLGPGFVMPGVKKIVSRGK